MESILGNLTGWLQNMGLTEDGAMIAVRLGMVAVILLLAFVLNRICWKTVVPVIRRITSKTGAKWDDYIFSDEVLKNLCRLITPIVIYALLPLAMLGEGVESFVLMICHIYLTIVCMMLVCSVISSLYNMSNEHEKLKEHSLKGFYQMLKLVVICIGSIIIISTLIGKSPIAILTGLGAGTAILMLVFQDTIKGFVAGIQLMANDMLRPGDWISMPKYGADGDVLEVTLTTVKVQNWDKTIVHVPPYALVNDSFQNWRGMFDSGGRRIKRSIYIDMNSIGFCTKEQIDRFMQKGWLEGLDCSEGEIVNLTVLRNYIDLYLRKNRRVNQEMILMVRQLQPTAQGLPLELYFFSADTAWVAYEHLQADVFEHLIAILPEFGIKTFQAPAGTDFSKVGK